MKETGFLRRLRNELPLWSKKGLVLESKQQAILDFVALEDQRNKASSSLIFALLGILLFGAGIITFFAANWGVIPKLLKLIILFGGMWLAYLIAYLTLASPKLSHLFLLLGCLLFGANIWLIAQIYHLQAFYPTGVLLWALGTLLVAVLLNDGPCLGLSILLGILWTLLYTKALNFMGGIHWTYLILWALQCWMVLKLCKQGFFNLLILGLLIWGFLSLSAINFDFYFVQFFTLLAATLFLISKISRHIPAFKSFDKIELSASHWGLFLILTGLFILTFPRFLYESQILPRIKGDFYPALLEVNLYMTLALIFINLIMLGVFFRIRKSRLHSNATSNSNFDIFRIFLGNTFLGVFLYLLVNGLILLTFIPNLVENHQSLFSLFYNILFFATTLWLILLGNQIREGFYINLGFFFFAIGLIARYFDTFWTLLNRSFFFMIGGLLLLIGSLVVEKYRRPLIRKIQGDTPRGSNNI